MKRLILCVGALVAMVANVAMVQGALYVENFDSTPEGGIPPDWHPEITGTMTIGATSAVAFGGSGKSMHIEDPGSGHCTNIYLDLSAPASNVVMDYYTRTQRPNDEGVNLVMFSDGGSDHSLSFRSTGYIGILGGGSGWIVPQLLKYKVDTWYHVIRTLDCTTNTGTFYVAEVDGDTWQDTADPENKNSHSIGLDYACDYVDKLKIGTSNTYGADAYIDQISARVPEPSTLAIWSVLALCGIAIGWRRRRKA